MSDVIEWLQEAIVDGEECMSSPDGGCQICAKDVPHLRKALAALTAARDLIDNHFDPVFCALDTIELKPTDEVNQKAGKLWAALR